MCRACFAPRPAVPTRDQDGDQDMVHEEHKGPLLKNPIHHSIVEKLDPAFVTLYNDHIANGPPQSLDINVVRANYSAIYSYATAPASGVGGIGATQVPAWEKY